MLFCKTYPVPDEPSVIGHDVWIGQGAVIMSGVTIENGVIIGCNAVVKDVETYQVVAGNPAKHIRYRFDKETIAELNHSQWWQYPLHELQQSNPKNIKAFISYLSTLETPANHPEIQLINRKILAVK